MRPNRERFIELMIEAGFKSQREFAKNLTGRDGGPMDHASLSRVLSGDRELLLSEAVEIAERFSAPLQEIVEIFLAKEQSKSSRKKLKSA